MTCDVNTFQNVRVTTENHKGEVILQVPVGDL